MAGPDSPAAPHEPPCVYRPGDGYEAPRPQDVPPEVRMRRGRDGADDSLLGADDSDVDDDDLYDALAYDDNDQEWSSHGGVNLAKSYNRQRQRLTPSAHPDAPLPASNRQKPQANTLTSIDDQVASLARHAAKIRLQLAPDRERETKDKADRATSDQVLDRRTRMILLQMINRGLIAEVQGAVSTGKEANVYAAPYHNSLTGEGGYRALKVYKTAILVFKDRERYIVGEHRFRAGFDKGNSRKMVQLWAEKEFRNLRRLYSAGIPCPEPISLKLHVLLMGFLGDSRGWAYPRLRDAVIDSDDNQSSELQWRRLYIQLLGIMRTLYQRCRLVHADLSEYNILYHQGTLFIIDVSQSVEPDHPRALDFLRADIKNVGDFFRRKGVQILPDRPIFDFITSPAGPVDGPALSETVQKLFDAHPLVLDDQQAAELEVDNQVFRNQYIPQNLRQVHDFEKDGLKVGRGEANDLIYSNLLADQLVNPDDHTPHSDSSQHEHQESSDGSSNDEEEDGSLSGQHAVSQNQNPGAEPSFEKGRPRGRRFEDKDEKKQHKQAVKEAKREKRKEKMPKNVKKKIVSSTSRQKK